MAVKRKKKKDMNAGKAAFQFTFRKTLPILQHSSQKILFQQFLYVITGVFQTLATQFLHYEGAAESTTMLTVAAAYFGMVLVWFTPRMEEIKKREIVVSQKKILTITFFDISGFVTLTVALFFIGSGTYQVIYSSVVVFTSLLSRILLKKIMSTTQWIAIITVTLGLAISALGNETGDHLTDVGYFTIGIFLGFVGTFLYACVYILNEKFLSGPPAVPPELVCFYIGLYGSIFSLLYIVFFTFPRWQQLVSQSIEAHGGNGGRIILFYLLLILAGFIHNSIYYTLVSSTGAVSTGILQAIRAIVVFVSSAYFFCSLETSQCFNLYKGISVVVVSLGTIAYSSASASASNSQISNTKSNLKSTSEEQANYTFGNKNQVFTL